MTEVTAALVGGELAECLSTGDKGRRRGRQNGLEGLGCQSDTPTAGEGEVNTSSVQQTQSQSFTDNAPIKLDKIETLLFQAFVTRMCFNVMRRSTNLKIYHKSYYL